MGPDSSVPVASAAPAPTGGVLILWWRRRWEVRDPTPRDAVVTGIVFGAVILLWSEGSLLIELAFGAHAHSGSPPPGSFALLDGLWHLATGLVVALPARRRTLLWAAPLFSLGLDVDHVFGAFLPTVLIRPAHDVFLLAILVVVLLVVEGRFAALAAPAAILVHFGVDGGAFPFFAPASLQYYPLSYAEQFGFIVVAVLVMFFSTRRVSELRDRRTMILMGIAIAVLAGMLALIPAGFATFTSN
ncbi:MAG: hypothetical protein L3K15_04745 [Thermoplasmata archaeon]|nr:hypothetical protein [Thermoplasmata archaeon]